MLSVSWNVNIPVDEIVISGVGLEDVTAAHGRLGSNGGIFIKPLISELQGWTAEEAVESEEEVIVVDEL